MFSTVVVRDLNFFDCNWLLRLDTCNQGTAIRFVDEVLRRLPFRVLVVHAHDGRITMTTTRGALDGQTPYERLVAKMRAGTSPAS